MGRFEARYQRRRETPRGGRLRKWALIAFSAVVVLLGLVLMPLPGPGILIVIAGGALMAGESLAVARLLDRGEAAVRRLIARLAHR